MTYRVVMAMNYDQYRQNCTEKGIEYQDFICEHLHQEGIVLQNMQSKQYQYKKENLLGLEIKFDDRMAETGRIYIETHEKAQPRTGDYAQSGINRQDCWLFGIGNYKVFFIFDKKVLRRIKKHNPSWLYWPHKDKETSKGFCIPLSKAREIAAKTIDFI